MAAIWSGLCAAQQGREAVAPAAPAAQAQAASKPRFNIFEYSVEGNRTLSTIAIERAVYRYLGENRTIDDVEGARAALEKAYRDAGFGTVGVDIPPQQVTDGVVVLQVVEGAVARTRVVGARYYSQQRILETVPALAEGQVPDVVKAQSELAELNRSADRRVTPVLKPGGQVGTTNVELSVDDKLPLHGSLTYDNRYTGNTTHSRLGLSLRYDNLWQREHSASFAFQTSPENTSEVKVYSLGYLMPVGRNYLAFSALRSDSNTAAGVGDVTVIGKGSIYGLRGIIPLPGGAGLQQSLTLGADYKDFLETVRVGPDTGFQTPVRYAPFSANYSGNLGDANGQWQIGGEFRFAVRRFLSRASEFDDKRFNAKTNFAVARFDVARLQKLGGPWSFFAKVDGQRASGPLISNEQYLAGGMDSVRGYLVAAAAGDSGVRTSAELRYAPQLSGDSGWLGQLEIYAFTDNSHATLINPLPQQQSRFSLRSLGIGLRSRFLQHASLRLDLGWPMTDLGSTRAGSARLQFSTAIEY